MSIETLHLIQQIPTKNRSTNTTANLVLLALVLQPIRDRHTSLEDIVRIEYVCEFDFRNLNYVLRLEKWKVVEYVIWDYLTGLVQPSAGNGDPDSRTQHVVFLISMELIKYYFAKKPIREILAVGVTRK